MIQISSLTVKSLARLIDHTLLKADATARQIDLLCDEALEQGFASVMVNPFRVRQCAERLSDSGIEVGTVIGFPLGAVTVADKLAEAETALSNGATELDYVLNIGALRDGDLTLIEAEMSDLTAACHTAGAKCKVIFETCCLTEEEIRAAAGIAQRVMPDFIKTSTGFGSAGATAANVRLMAQCVGNQVGVKAAGGIRTWLDCRAMLEAGATRIGASAGRQILEQFAAAQEK